jgi:Zn-dependent M28 family amino/carboxypeptidase
MTRRPGHQLVWLLGAWALLCACNPERTQGAVEPAVIKTPAAAPAAPVAVPEVAIAADELLRHIEVLAADALEGRAPGTYGEHQTIAYLVQQLHDMGLEPGNPDGTYAQAVPLVGYRNQTELAIEVAGKPWPIAMPDEAIAGSRRFVSELAVDASQLVFVGYGIDAPEYQWNDYEGLDVAGKTLVMLVGDPPIRPPIRDPANPAELDASMFKGRAMTYYGRWTYKFEIASEKGAAAVLIVHEDEPAGYPYAVVSEDWGREGFDIEQPDASRELVAFEGWISRPAAERLFAAAGHDFESLKQAALRRDFRPVALNARASFRNRQTRRQVRSHNVLARLPGADPAVRDEVVIYTAHWDHLGIDATLTGDRVFNGAIDNASGVAGVLALARAFADLPAPPRRSIVFMLLTAEEHGLLGAKHYTGQPLYPLEKTLANINIDGMNPWGPTRDVSMVGHGMSTLDELTAAAAAAQGRTVTPDSEPEKGFYFRSDHVHFARRGVPALYLDPGSDYVGKPASFAEQKRADYNEKHYHQVSDEVDPAWDLAGAAQDVELLFRVGYMIADGDIWPTWKPGAEFEAVRARMLERARR